MKKIYASVEVNDEEYDVEIALDEIIENAGGVGGVPVFRSDGGVWLPAPGYEEELEEALSHQADRPASCKFCNQYCFVPFPQGAPPEAIMAYSRYGGRPVAVVATCHDGQAFERRHTDGWNHQALMEVIYGPGWGKTKG